MSASIPTTCAAAEPTAKWQGNVTAKSQKCQPSNVNNQRGYVVPNGKFTVFALMELASGEVGPWTTMSASSLGFACAIRFFHRRQYASWRWLAYAHRPARRQVFTAFRRRPKSRPLRQIVPEVGKTASIFAPAGQAPCLFLLIVTLNYGLGTVIEADRPPRFDR